MLWRSKVTSLPRGEESPAPAESRGPLLLAEIRPIVVKQTSRGEKLQTNSKVGIAATLLSARNQLRAVRAP